MIGWSQCLPEMFPSCYRMFHKLSRMLIPSEYPNWGKKLSDITTSSLIKWLGHKMNHASSGVVGQGSLGDSCTRSLAATANQLLGVTLGKILWISDLLNLLNSDKINNFCCLTSQSVVFCDCPRLGLLTSGSSRVQHFPRCFLFDSSLVFSEWEGMGQGIDLSSMNAAPVVTSH